MLFLLGIIACSNGSSGGDGGGEDNRPAINITYTGSYTIGSDAGQHSIFCEAYSDTAGLLAQDGTGEIFTISSVENPWEQRLNPQTGDYYLAAFIDLNDDYIITGGEPYVIYDGQSCSGTPTAVQFVENAVINITFDDTNTDWP